MKSKIIPLSEISYEQWNQLWQSYLSFYQTTQSIEQTQLTWQRLSNLNQPDLFGFAIQINHVIVGFVHLIAHPSTWTALPYCYLQDLFVHQDYRNMGLARQLIEYSYLVCSGRFDRVYWLTHENNQTAQLLYDRIATKTGFIQYKQSL